MEERKKLKRKYQLELAEQLTGRSRNAINMMQKRRGFTLAEAIRYYMEA